VVVLHIAAYRKVSLVDEFQHIDSAWKVSHGQLPRPGEKVGVIAMEIESCRGLDADFPVPECGPKRPSDRLTFQEAGFNTAYIHGPIYYAVAGLSGRALSRLGFTDFLDGARLTGAAWLALGLVGCWVLLGMFGLRRWWRLAAAASPVLIPGMIFSASIVNPDATALAAGAWSAVAAVSLVRRRWPMVSVVLVSAVAVALKSTNLVAVGAVTLYLLAVAVREPSRRRTLLVGAIGCVGAIAVVGFVWLLVLGKGTGEPVPMLEQYKVEHITASMITSNIYTAVPPTRLVIDPVLSAGVFTIAMAAVLSWLLASGPLLAAVTGPHEDVRLLAGASLVAAFSVGPLYVVTNFLVSSIYVVIPPRYGLSLVAAMAVVTLAVLSRRRRGVWTALVAVGTALVIVQLAVSI